jgi:hypothetical protein
MEFRQGPGLTKIIGGPSLESRFHETNRAIGDKARAPSTLCGRGAHVEKIDGRKNKNIGLRTIKISGAVYNGKSDGIIREGSIGLAVG